jgi:glucose-6-phosphate dehydrogenase assembly protein OpcA
MDAGGGVCERCALADHLTTTELKQVSVGAIRDELRALWAAEAVDDEAVIRARTHNLVVYTAGSSSVEETTRHVTEIVSERPGRVVVINAQPGEKPGLDAWVSTYCRDADRRRVCGEVITLAVRGSLRDEVHSTVTALLAPDLPVYLWWMELPDKDDHLFKHLAGEADRVLVDSDSSTDPAKGLREIAALDVGLLGDLNWARLTPWRSLLAQLWDAPALRESLDHIKSLDVHYIARGDFLDSARALLLVGWLADRLGWALVSAQTGPTGGYITTWRKQDWEGKVELVESTHESLPAGEVVGVFVQAGAKPPYVMPRLELMPERECVEVRFNDASPSASRMGVPAQPVGVAGALIEELELGYDPAYEAALKRAVEIVDAV